MRPIKTVRQSIGEAAVRVAREVNAEAIISLEKKAQKVSKSSTFGFKPKIMDIITPPKTLVRVVIFKKQRKGASLFAKKCQFDIEVRSNPSEGVGFIKEVLMTIIREKWIKKGDRLVCVADSSLGVGYTGLLFLYDVDKTFFDMSVHGLDKDVSSDVLEAVINLAKEIGTEGREGRKIGTGFIVGDSEAVLKLCQQLVLNPFAGYPQEERNITDPRIKETIKEFAQLDGVFIIGSEGIIHSAGTYVRCNTKSVKIQSGLGTRHLVCAAITKETKAISVVVSSSGGVVRVFKNGHLVMEEK
jgi:DNA integrity scanning protein DisA with diadenylate cyclase activity